MYLFHRNIYRIFNIEALKHSYYESIVFQTHVAVIKKNCQLGKLSAVKCKVSSRLETLSLSIGRNVTAIIKYVTF